MAQWDIATLDTRLEYFSSGNGRSASCKLSDTTVMLAYSDNVNDGWARTYTIDRSTGVLTAWGSAFEFDGADALMIQLIRIDDTHALALWTGTGNDGFAAILTVNSGTGAITMPGGSLEFDTSNGQYISGFLLDSTHAWISWQGATNARSQVLALNTGTGAVTTVGSPLDIGSNLYSTHISMISSTKAIFTALGSVDEDLKGCVLSVDGSYAVTNATGSVTTLKTVASSNSQTNAYIGLDGSNHIFVTHFYDGSTHKIRSWNANSSTWALTARGAEFNQGGDVLNVLSGHSPFVLGLDLTHFVAFSNTASGTGPTIRVYSLDGSSGDITQVSTAAIGAGTSDQVKGGITINDLGSGLFLSSWISDTDDGNLAQAFTIQLTAPSASSRSPGGGVAIGAPMMY